MPYADPDALIDPCDYYAAMTRGSRAERLFHPARLRLLRAAVQLEGRAVLDVGAGSGAMTVPLARSGIQITATELSARHLHSLRGYGAAEGLDIPVVQADASALPFADHSFDALLLISVVHLLPFPGPVLREAERVCRPGGRIVIAGPWHLHPKAMAFFKRLLGKGEQAPRQPFTMRHLDRWMLRSSLIRDKLDPVMGYRVTVWEPGVVDRGLIEA